MAKALIGSITIWKLGLLLTSVKTEDNFYYEFQKGHLYMVTSWIPDRWGRIASFNFCFLGKLISNMAGAVVGLNVHDDKVVKVFSGAR